MPAAQGSTDALLPLRRTAAGQAELTARERALSQRHRTVLFLIDGRRGRDEIRRLAQQAGADERCLDDLVERGLVSAAPAPDGGGDESSVLPSSLSLQGDSRWSAFDESAPGPRPDLPLAEARALLLRAVRAESPVAGAFTLMRLKRARSREALEALLDEVEQRLRKPHRQIIAAQTLRHVRHLLSLPSHSTPPAA